MIKEQLEEVRKNIEEACKRAGRDPKEVTLIAVSKTKPVPMLEEAYVPGILAKIKYRRSFRKSRNFRKISAGI